MKGNPPAINPFELTWKQVNARYAPIIFAIGGTWTLFDILVHHFATEHSFWEFEKFHWVITVDLILIPMAAVNFIFLVQRFFAKRIHSGWPMVVLKIVATLTSVFFTSLALETFYTSLGYVDGDYLSLGFAQFSPATSNVIANTVYAAALGIPMFIWQLRVEQLYVALRQKEVERAELQQLKTQAELHALQSRINPHFLFNSFNSIASLIQLDAARAEKMVVQLSELFRYSLNSEESHFVSISVEMEIVKTYLEVEKVRFGENLEYEIQIPQELLELEVPRFLIQPLVENAVKHATAHVKQGEIRVEMLGNEEKLDIKVFDNGPAFPDEMVKGYGLKSTFDKLRLLYPNRHKVEAVNQPHKHIHVQLTKSTKHG